MPAMKKILILTDSLGVPRTRPELLADDVCWVYRLVDEGSDRFRFRLSTVPGLDSRQLLAMSRLYHAAIVPDVIVLQVGIVDAYPRALKRIELSLLARLPGFLSRFVHALVKRFYASLVRLRNIHYVEPEEFRRNLLEFRSLFPDTRILVLPVAPATAEYRRRNPLVAQSIADYNLILGEVFGEGFLGDCFAGEPPEAVVTSDNHHLSELGNERVFEVVRRALAAG
ncbi:MAG: hypothetical protein K0Q68_383 [Moraxellaceae bacterium]|jgi:hypothetical protein|nr:hypothetical protein [Moraxellaceae bacterium]